MSKIQRSFRKYYEVACSHQVRAHSAFLRSVINPRVVGLGALLASSILPANAQYADWTATPPKILPNERPGSGLVISGNSNLGSGRQFSNPHAFAALKADGSIATWGLGYYYDSSPGLFNEGPGFYFASQALPRDTGYKAIYSNESAFAALKADGSIVAWGATSAGGSGAPTGNGYTAIYSTLNAFAALKADGSIKAWGDSSSGGGSTGFQYGNPPTDVGYKAIYSNSGSFVALKGDGSIRQWGDPFLYSGPGAVLPPTGTGFIAIYPSASGYAALKADGSIAAWGVYGDTITPNIVPSGTGYTTICANSNAFAALKSDGSISAWGHPYGGGVGAPTDTGYTAIYSNLQGFAALKTDGSIRSWGDPSNTLFTQPPTDNGYTAIYSTDYGFSAIKADGTISYWGMPITTAAPSGNGYRAICSNGRSFAALRADGSIYSWGELNGSAAPTGTGYKGIYSNRFAFAAIKADGTISAWGENSSSNGPAGNNFRSVQSVLNYGQLVFDPELTGTLGSITSSTAVIGGNVTSMADKTAASRGVVYALASSNVDPQIGGSSVTQVAESPLGSTATFEVNLSGLIANTAYVFKAYVTDTDGVSYYSTVATFSTNLPPVIISNGGNTNVDVSVAENSSAVSTVSASDADAGQSVTYSISGGADAARFAIGSSSGALTFAAAPDFEAPADANTDNVYEVIVAATDNGNPPKSATQTFAVTVTNVADSAEITVEQPAGTNVATGGTVAFGSVTVGQPLELTFTVRSSGEVPLLLSGATISGTHPEEFALVGSLQSSLAIGNSTTFSVRFTPIGGGTRSAFLSLPNNDQSGGESSFVINLSGTGVSSATVATYANAANQVRGGWINSGNFTIGTVGTTNPANNWPSAEGPDKVVDSNTGSKFLIFRNSNAGLILNPTNSNVVFNRLSLSTANDASERDPASYIIYGSTTALSGTAGTNISLAGLTELASGTITLPDNRTTGPTVVQFANTTAYASYIVAFPTVRSTTSNTMTQISEVQLSQGMNSPSAVAMAGARGGQLSSGTFTFGSIGSSNPGTNWLANESPDQAIDGSVSTKYLIFRNTGAGLIASPQAGPARVNNLSFWTANDSAERDPLTYEVYGFATAVTARSGTLNVTTNGTLLGSGTLTLPATRNAGPVNVAFANTTEYASYLVVFPTVKNSPSTTMMQIAEVQFGYNTAPDFSIFSPVVNLNENSGPQSYAAFATEITAGLGDVGQTVSFTCTNDNNALFSAQPAIATDGTLTFTTSTNSYGSAVVTVVATDNLGSSSEPKTFNVEVAIVPLISRSASLLGDFTAVTGNASSSQSFVVNARALSGPVVVTAPSGFEISTDNSNFSSSLTLSTKPGTIDSIYGGSFNIASGRIWGSGNGKEFPNYFAFAAITSTGSVVAWGDTRFGGSISAVANNLSSNVTGVYSNFYSFAALKTDGSIVTWGDARYGGNSTSVANNLTSNVAVVYSTERAFAALKTDGSVVTWGDAGYGGDSAAVASSLTSNVQAVYSNTKAFAALKKDGSVVTWGDTSNGGNSTSVAASLTSGVTAVYSTGYAFAALKGDGSVVTWGDSLYGGDSSPVSAKLTSNVTAVYSTSNAFAALKTDGSVVTWGDSFFGGYSDGVASKLASNVATVYSSSGAFAALKADGSVVTWGDSRFGGYSTDVASSLASNVVEIYSTTFAFAALKIDGSVVTWGGAANGGDSTTVASSLTSNVTAVYSTGYAFAALKTDRSLVIWGNTNSGGDASAVAGNLTSNVASVYSTYTAFAALKTDGSVLTWGNGSYGGFGGPANIGVNSMPATVYTRLSPTAPTGSVFGNLSLVSSGAQPQTVALSGTVTSQASYTHLELWRFANFGSYDSVDSGADSADPDGDGLSNLMEYALGLSPNNSGVIPAALSLSGANLEYTYTRSSEARDNGVTYQIEWSDTLTVGSWSTETVTEQITSTQGALETVKASIPKGTGGKRFLRLRVGAAPIQTP